MKLKNLVASAVCMLAMLTSATSSAFCLFNCDYTKTKYPIVLAHGFLGWDTLAGVDYWYGIVDALTDGGATVYVTTVSPINSSVARGESLIAQLDQIRAVRGQPNLKFNLISHSQGGLDVRYVAGTRPDLVASVTTIAGPHGGVDPSLANLMGSLDPSVLQPLAELIGLLYPNNDPIDIAAAFSFFDPAYTQAFNTSFPGGMPTTPCGQGEAVTQSAAGPIRNYSWTGNRVITNALDPGDALLATLTLISSGAPTDGLIPVCSAHFGTVLRDNYAMNHLDEVNQLFGLVAIFETNPKTVFRAHANRLKAAGL